VLIERRTRDRRPVATPLVAAWAAILLVLAMVVPALATDGPTQLSDASVSPRTGTTTTTITFEVRYHNHEGSAPDHVNVLIDGAAHAMTGDGNWRQGVVMHWAGKLAVGTHHVAFEAADTRRFVSHLDAGTVTIRAPEPTPTPKPTATPEPTPRSTPAPTPKPTPEPTPTPAGSTPAPGDTTTPGGTTGGPVGPDAGDPGTTGEPIPTGWTEGPTGGGSVAWPWGGETASGGSSDAAGGDGSTNPDASAGPGDLAAGPLGGPGDGSAGGGPGSGAGSGGGDGTGPGWGTLTAALDVLGVRPSSTTTVLPMLVGTSTATAMAFAFAIFGKKRRDEEPPAPDEVLQAQAARGHDRVLGADALLGATVAATLPPIDAAEAGMPRWRRPSVQAARKSDPNRYVESARMSFETGAVTAIEGHERRVIRYRVVRLLDAPDELRSADIGQLDQGDEVQLLERSGAYWRVLCPDGRQGWLHKMTLGEVVRDDAAASAAAAQN
jgi:hypothetical protein